MVNYYKVLGVYWAKQKGIITDELVERMYLGKREQYIKMSNKEMKNKKMINIYKKMKNINIYNEIMEAWGEDDYLTLLEDAYYATKTKEARQNYDNLLKMLEEHIQKTKKESLKFTTQIKTSKANKDFKTLLENINKKPEDTTILIKKIMENEAKKHPIPGQNKGSNIEENER